MRYGMMNQFEREMRSLDRFLASGCENPLVFLFRFFLEVIR
jgi:hypothetical protein